MSSVPSGSRRMEHAPSVQTSPLPEARSLSSAHVGVAVMSVSAGLTWTFTYGPPAVPTAAPRSSSPEGGSVPISTEASVAPTVFSVAAMT